MLSSADRGLKVPILCIICVCVHVSGEEKLANPIKVMNPCYYFHY